MVHRHPLFPVLLTLAALTAAAAAQPPGSAGPPQLDLDAAGPIDLIFEEPTSVLDVYRAVGKIYGLNFVFDPKLRDQKVTLRLDQVEPSAVLATIGHAVAHFHKVLDERTVLIADDTPQNRRTYDEQVVQTFYLEHADYRDVMTMVRSLIGAKHVAADEALGALVIRDTAAKVRLAEEIIRAHDKPRAMVAVEVALLEVDAGRLSVLSGDSEAEGSGPPLTVDAAAMERILDAPGVRTVTRARLSTSSREKAELALKHSVPMPARAAGHGGREAAAASADGRDPAVGLELWVEPAVHAGHRELTLEVWLRIDYLDDLAPAGEAPRPVPTTRELSSEVRVGDGETVFLSGLWSLDGCPSGTSDRTLALLAPRACDPRDATARHLLIALTPRITQRPEITDRDRAPVAIGTEAHVDFPRRLAAAIE